MKVAESLRELERQTRRLRESIEGGDVESALSIIGGRLTDALTDVSIDLVRWARVEDVTPERCGVLLGMPAETIYNALREGSQ